MTAAEPSTMRRDIASAYLAAATKIGSWVVISAIVYRWLGAGAFAMVSLVRATLSILNYTTLGLAPAMMNVLAKAYQSPSLRNLIVAEPTKTLDYASADPLKSSSNPVHVIFYNGMLAGLICFGLALLLVVLYTEFFTTIHHVPIRGFPNDFLYFVYLFGIGVAVRLWSDVAGATLQTHHRITLDNLLVASADVLWVVLSWILLERSGQIEVAGVGLAYLIAAIALFVARLIIAGATIGLTRIHSQFALSIVMELFVFGGGVTIAQLADYLYAPIDFVLINRLLDPVLAAVYSPAVQIDGGLLLLVTGVASVLLPKTAMAHSKRNVSLIRKYYLRGTFFTGGFLALAAIVVWLLSPWIFRLWLKDPMTATQAILPLVLIHTVIGGSSAVGRSILLGMGKVKPFTIAVLLAGASNVILSYCFVRFFGLGLKGIILGTIVVVVARCAIWQPWYVLRTLRDGEARSEPN
ncbi:MAG TPA: lipopolysaccharide biosynthesis protein [Tepidisphaeraceae bacterium]|jgi:O-antigen/teichoic acid export membrane protein|nr:lipopolysaccharide biosynthesis protein [Tepidisphaeraceae bacterium]